MKNITDRLEQTVKDLASELGAAHATFMKLLLDLRATPLNKEQSALVSVAMMELRVMQKKFLETYGDDLGFAKPENN